MFYHYHLSVIIQLLHTNSIHWKVIQSASNTVYLRIIRFTLALIAHIHFGRFIFCYFIGVCTAKFNEGETLIGKLGSFDAIWYKWTFFYSCLCAIKQVSSIAWEKDALSSPLEIVRAIQTHLMICLRFVLPSFLKFIGGSRYNGYKSFSKIR